MDTTKGSMDPAGADVVVRTLSLLGCDLGGGGGGGMAVFVSEEVDGTVDSGSSMVVSSVFLRLELYGLITVVQFEVLLVDLFFKVDVDDDADDKSDDDAIVPTKVRLNPSKTARVDATMDA